MPEFLKNTKMSEVEEKIARMMIENGVREDVARINVDAMGIADMEMFLEDMSA
jgi:hypothetical protein